VSVKRARFYDALALLTVILVIALDQWTKSLVVKNIPLFSQVPFPLVGKYLVLEHIHNSGAAFSMFSKGGSAIFLIVLIVIAICIVGYLYVKTLNTGPLVYKLIFGLIMGGAFGNLTDRAIHSGYVVDFISFRIPEINFYFAIFNIADACISLGVVFLFLFLVFGRGLDRNNEVNHSSDIPKKQNSNPSTLRRETLRMTERDAQS
jgi:signal peptidase II